MYPVGVPSRGCVHASAVITSAPSLPATVIFPLSSRVGNPTGLGGLITSPLRYVAAPSPQSVSTPAPPLSVSAGSSFHEVRPLRRSFPSPPSSNPPAASL